MRYTVITSTPLGYGKAVFDAEDDEMALWKVHVAEAFCESEVVCVIPGEVYPIVPPPREIVATVRDAMEDQSADCSVRLDNGSGAFPYDSFAIAASAVSLAMSLASIAMSLAVLLGF